jgi:hypothetical protein
MSCPDIVTRPMAEGLQRSHKKHALLLSVHILQATVRKRLCPYRRSDTFITFQMQKLHAIS